MWEQGWSGYQQRKMCEGGHDHGYTCGSGTFRWDENNSWEGDAMAGRDELMNEWIGIQGIIITRGGPHQKTRGQDRTGRINMQCFGVVLCVPGNIYCHHCKYCGQGFFFGCWCTLEWSGEEAPHLWWNNGGQAGAWQEWMLPLSTEWLPPGQADRIHTPNGTIIMNWWWWCRRTGKKTEGQGHGHYGAWKCSNKI